MSHSIDYFSRENLPLSSTLTPSWSSGWEGSSISQKVMKVATEIFMTLLLPLALLGFVVDNIKLGISFVADKLSKKEEIAKDDGIELEIDEVELIDGDIAAVEDVGAEDVAERPLMTLKRLVKEHGILTREWETCSTEKSSVYDETRVISFMKQFKDGHRYEDRQLRYHVKDDKIIIGPSLIKGDLIKVNGKVIDSDTELKEGDVVTVVVLDCSSEIFYGMMLKDGELVDADTHGKIIYSKCRSRKTTFIDDDSSMFMAAYFKCEDGAQGRDNLFAYHISGDKITIQPFFWSPHPIKVNGSIIDRPTELKQGDVVEVGVAESSRTEKLKKINFIVDGIELIEEDDVDGVAEESRVEAKEVVKKSRPLVRKALIKEHGKITGFCFETWQVESSSLYDETNEISKTAMYEDGFHYCFKKFLRYHKKGDDVIVEPGLSKNIFVKVNGQVIESDTVLNEDDNIEVSQVCSDGKEKSHLTLPMTYLKELKADKRDDI
jgi:sulfur carrier protein ThiS